MVRGLATFKNHFADYSDQYVLIGGAASSELMERSGLVFRGTRDLDIVLIVEVLRAEFVKVFWDFIEKGKYGSRFQSQREKKYYRFDKPEDEIYPECIELFSRIPEGINFEGYGHITPIPVDEDISSLSAILLDADYYSLITAGSTEVNGLSCLKPEYIIILKAKAWLDMNLRLSNGEKIDSKDIKKHRNDVLRLFPILEPTLKLEIPEAIQNDLKIFFESVNSDTTINLKDLGISQISLPEIVRSIRQIYGLSN